MEGASDRPNGLDLGEKRLEHEVVCSYIGIGEADLLQDFTANGGSDVQLYFRHCIYTDLLPHF